MLRSVSKHHHWNSVSWRISEDSVSQKQDITSRKLLLQRLKDRLAFLTDDDLGAWSDIKFRLKNKFISLTDDDLYLIEGREDELISNLLKKVGDNTGNLRKLSMVL